MAYNSENFTERELGEIKKSDKSFIRVAHITDNETHEEFVDIRQGFIKNDEKALTGKGVRISKDNVPELVAALEEFVNS